MSHHSYRSWRCPMTSEVGQSPLSSNHLSTKCSPSRLRRRMCRAQPSFSSSRWPRWCRRDKIAIHHASQSQIISLLHYSTNYNNHSNTNSNSRLCSRSRTRKSNLSSSRTLGLPTSKATTSLPGSKTSSHNDYSTIPEITTNKKCK